MRRAMFVLVCLLAFWATTLAQAGGQGCEDCEIIKKGVPESTPGAAAPARGTPALPAPGEEAVAGVAVEAVLALAAGLVLAVGGGLTAALLLRAARRPAPMAPNDVNQHHFGENNER